MEFCFIYAEIMDLFLFDAVSGQYPDGGRRDSTPKPGSPGGARAQYIRSGPLARPGRVRICRVSPFHFVFLLLDVLLSLIIVPPWRSRLHRAFPAFPSLFFSTFFSIFFCSESPRRLRHCLRLRRILQRGPPTQAPESTLRPLIISNGIKPNAKQAPATSWLSQFNKSQNDITSHMPNGPRLVTGFGFGFG